MAPPFSPRWIFGMSRFTLLFGVSAIILFCVFFFSETGLSYRTLNWHYRMQQALQKSGRVGLSELVDFNWEWIYFIRPYDTSIPDGQESPIPDFGLLDPPWWHGDTRYWTIVYMRIGTTPFTVRLSYADWVLRKGIILRTNDRKASLVLVRPNDELFKECPRGGRWGQCLALDDERTRNQMKNGISPQ